jgi:hypothetical protein
MFAVTQERSAHFNERCIQLGRVPRTIWHSLVVFAAHTMGIGRVLPRHGGPVQRDGNRGVRAVLAAQVARRLTGGRGLRTGRSGGHTGTALRTLRPLTDLLATPF